MNGSSTTEGSRPSKRKSSHKGGSAGKRRKVSKEPKLEVEAQDKVQEPAQPVNVPNDEPATETPDGSADKSQRFIVFIGDLTSAQRPQQR
jgi:hypothetical protein